MAGQGYGCRRIVRLLESKGVYCGKSSVDRPLRGLPPYRGNRVCLHEFMVLLLPDVSIFRWDVARTGRYKSTNELPSDSRG